MSTSFSFFKCEIKTLYKKIRVFLCLNISKLPCGLFDYLDVKTSLPFNVKNIYPNTLQTIKTSQTGWYLILCIKPLILGVGESLVLNLTRPPFLKLTFTLHQ